ncbi:transcription factor PIF3-like [Senna tora]|uniref:Transcription factor PIF3-like n=1 Tax=Senna tora TaxID=362788 RepID=A0A834TB99_9FABA|nr:transcription factor PIF3-like [Senna tora]
MGKFGDLDSGFNEIPRSVPSGELDLSQDEDMIPWLNYTMDDSLQHEYSSDFMRDLSGITVNELPPSSNFALMDKGGNCSQIYKDSHKNLARDVSSSERANQTKGSSAEDVETTRPNRSTSQLYPPSSQQCQPSFASFRSKVSDITGTNTSNAIHQASCGEPTHIPSTSSGFCSLNMQKQDPLLPSNSSNILNFSHFARPAAIVKANLQSISLMSGLSSVRSESMGTKNKDVNVTSSHRPESTLVDSRGKKNCQLVMDPSKAELEQSEPKSLEQKAAPAKQSDPACEQEDAFKNDQIANQVLCESATKGQKDIEKVMDPVVASSSICSGNGMKRCSDDPTQNFKRKNRDTEDSECHSEEVEEESVGIKKAAPARGMGSKRSRAAEVHNLSERRRRDRINEKMRALQELIPNCNKIMSMGAGLYMPPMMLHPGMQHMHAPRMAPFSPMGVGMQMGLGMGYGMNISDMNSGSSRFPMLQVPQMQGTHFPVLPMTGPTALHGMARSNAQLFGFPGQGLPMPMPHAPAVSLSGGPPMNPSTSGSNACGAAGLVETVDSASASGLKDPLPNVNSLVMPPTGGSNSTSQMSTQCEATNAGIDQSALVQSSGDPSNVNDSGPANPGKEDKLVIGYD